MAAGGTGSAARLARTLLTPLSICYSRIQSVRAECFRSGLCAAMRLPRPVISVGNITVGGTGKTPVTAWIAVYLLEQGLRVAVLSRGYGGTMEGKAALVSDGRNLLLRAEQCGDEPYLMAASVPGLAVAIGGSRHEAGLLALEHLNPDVFILDDGFQHLRLHRDLNILLLDFRNPFGNGRTLPAGPLREPVSACKRADLVIYTRAPAGAVPPGLLTGIPCCTAGHRLKDLIPLDGGTPVSFQEMTGKVFTAFAGIADPEDFFRALRDRGLSIGSTMALDDHASYDRSFAGKLSSILDSGADRLAVTTAKDAVKLGSLPEPLRARIMAARLEVEFASSAILSESLRNILQK